MEAFYFGSFGVDMHSSAFTEHQSFLSILVFTQFCAILAVQSNPYHIGSEDLVGD
jgi:hypothetical protein